MNKSIHLHFNLYILIYRKYLSKVYTTTDISMLWVTTLFDVTIKKWFWYFMQQLLGQNTFCDVELWIGTLKTDSPQWLVKCFLNWLVFIYFFRGWGVGRVFFLLPPPLRKQSLRNIGITLSDCPFVCAIVSSLNISYRETFEILISHKDCLLRKGASWFWPKDIWASSRSLEGLCPVHIFPIKINWKFWLHTKVAYYLRVCSNFTQCYLSKEKPLEGKV